MVRSGPPYPIDPVPETTHAALTLSLLEAMKNLDTPLDDGLPDMSGEHVARRLGLSPTVAMQIERYHQLATRHGTVPWREAVSVFRLVARRQDASLVFADAGRRVARHLIRHHHRAARAGLQLLPRRWQQRAGRRTAARIAAEYLGTHGTVGPEGAAFDLEYSLARDADALGAGCVFYGSALAELLRLLSGFEGAVVHETCAGTGAEQCSCRWRTAVAEGYA